MADQEETKGSPSFLELAPRKAGVRDLSRLLRDSDLTQRDFVDGSDDTQVKLKYRRLIFVSTLMQKLLLFFSTPLAFMGRVFEMFLNFLSYNHSPCAFVKNLKRGTLIPRRDSAEFVSYIGFLDGRIKLEPNIKPGDGFKYYSALCMMASKVAYENKARIEHIVKDHLNMEFLGFYSCWNDYQQKTTTEVFLLRDKSDDRDTIVVAFRGTEPFSADDWCTDWDLSHHPLRDPKSHSLLGNVHDGFMKALGLSEVDEWPANYKDGTGKQNLAYYFIRDKLKTLLDASDRTNYIVTGHSLGGALAILFPTILFCHDEKFLLERLQGVYTYGQPRVGDGMLGKFMERKLKEHNIRYFRFVYSYDMVPRLPYDDKDHWYKHFGKALYYNPHYHGAAVTELPNKNYFSIILALATMVNAVYEMVRSFVIVTKMIMSAVYELGRCFVIHYTRGPYYKEGWVLCTTRITGLLVPGVSDHSPQDYVNCTCLGQPGFPPEEMSDS
ncbi:hypothetical protein GQ457_18G002190 [Hibiscus cannabinus]